MSGPLTNLRKSRKVPLPSSQGGKWVPFRDSGSYTTDETKLLDEITNQMATTRIKASRSSTDPVLGGLPKLDRSSISPRLANTNTTPSGSESGSICEDDIPLEHCASDHELMGLMMSRLGQLEQRLQHQAKEILEKDKRIKILEEKNNILQKYKGTNNVNDTQDLQRKCLLLQQKNHEMETFLADYGMMWLGEQGDDDETVYHKDSYDEQSDDISETASDPQPMWRPATSHGNPEFSVDFEKLMKNLNELNDLAGEGQAQIMHTADGARFKVPDAVPFTVFSNGIILYSGPFRSFSEASTQQCVQDILDGYFPGEMQNRYPDGIPFQVFDKRSMFFRDKRDLVFQGEGQALGGETKPSRLVPSKLTKPSSTSLEQRSGNKFCENTLGLEETSTLPGHKLTVDQFLNHLPKNVVKEGKVINIRNHVAEALKGGKEPSSQVTLVETQGVKGMKERLAMPDGNRPDSCRNLATLRVKDENGNQTYVLRMKFTETIGDLRRYLNKERKTGSQQAYEIMSTFPNRIYSDNSATLQECDLVSNAILHLKTKKMR